MYYTQVILLTTVCTHKRLIRTRKKKCDFTSIATFVKTQVILFDKPSTFSIVILEELCTYPLFQIRTLNTNINFS